MTKLIPFQLGGVLPICPECNATGDYKLLSDRVEDLYKTWLTMEKYPDNARKREKLHKMIYRAFSAIDKSELVSQPEDFVAVASPALFTKDSI